jgi:hypothetical protein
MQVILENGTWEFVGKAQIAAPFNVMCRAVELLTPVSWPGTIEPTVSFNWG